MALLASADESSVLGEQASRSGGEVQYCGVSGRLECQLEDP